MTPELRMAKLAAKAMSGLVERWEFDAPILSHFRRQGQKSGDRVRQAFQRQTVREVR